jgi:hypothetical protein
VWVVAVASAGWPFHRRHPMVKKRSLEVEAVAEAERNEASLRTTKSESKSSKRNRDRARACNESASLPTNRKGRQVTHEIIRKVIGRDINLPTSHQKPKHPESSKHSESECTWKRCKSSSNQCSSRNSKTPDKKARARVKSTQQQRRTKQNYQRSSKTEVWIQRLQN